mmetsp:Transcript_114742/g.335519  ORF Transcript_114742/g.335519 Transcript_114742/m.335519 type:complete len:238 (-) Transcript_114742:217-930(-)
MDALARRVGVDAHTVCRVEDRMEDPEVVQRGDHVVLPLRQRNPQQASAARAAVRRAELLGVARVHVLPLAGLVDDALELLHLPRLQEAAHVVDVLDLTSQEMRDPTRLGHRWQLHHLVELGNDGLLGIFGTVLRLPLRKRQSIRPPVRVEASDHSRRLLEGAEVPLTHPVVLLLRQLGYAPESVRLEVGVLGRRQSVLVDVHLEAQNWPFRHPSAHSTADEIRTAGQVDHVASLCEV